MNVGSLPRRREADIARRELLFDKGLLPDRLTCEVEERLCEF